VLTALMDVELAAVRLGVAIRLLRSHEANVAAAVGITEGWWADAHRELTVFELDALKLGVGNTVAGRSGSLAIFPAG
jgi:hypothetical protein